MSPIGIIPKTNMDAESRDLGLPDLREMAQNTTTVLPNRKLCCDYISTVLPLDLLVDIIELLGPRDRLSLMRTSRDMHAVVKARMWRRGPDCWDSAMLLEMSNRHIIGGYNITGLESSHAGALIYAIKKRRYDFAYRALQARLVSPELVRSLLRPAAGYSGACIKLLRLLLAHLPDPADAINRPEEGIGRLPLLLEVATSRLPHGSSAAVLRLLLRRGGNPNLEWNGAPLLFQLDPRRGRRFSRLLVHHGADILQPNGFNIPNLGQAVISDRAYLLPHLVNAGVDVLAPGPWGFDAHANVFNTTAFWLAVRWRSTNVIRALLRLGADPERRGLFGQFPRPVRPTDNCVGVCRAFLDHGVPVDARGPKQCTVLILAAKERAPKMIRMLLKRGANPMLTDVDGFSALDWLCRGQEFFNSKKMHDTAVQMIFAGCRLKQKQRDEEEEEEEEEGEGVGKHDADLWDEPPWRIAMSTRHWSLVLHVLRHQRRYDPCDCDSKGMTLLMHAAREAVGSAIWGYDFARKNMPWWPQRLEAVTACDDAGKTALYWAVNSSDRYLCRRLLRAGADPNEIDSSGHTLLNLAARGRDPVVLEILLQWGSHVNAEDNYGRTALCHAACNMYGTMRTMVRLLMAAGADAQFSDDDAAATPPGGRPGPLQWAKMYGQEAAFRHAVKTWHLPEPFDRSSRFPYPQRPEWAKEADQVAWLGYGSFRMSDMCDEVDMDSSSRGSFWDRDNGVNRAGQQQTNTQEQG